MLVIIPPPLRALRGLSEDAHVTRGFTPGILLTNCRRQISSFDSRSKNLDPFLGKKRKDFLAIR